LPSRKSHDSVCHPVNDRIKCSRVDQQHAVAF
jgi:hypothetical protein